MLILVCSLKAGNLFLSGNKRLPVKKGKEDSLKNLLKK